MGVIPNRSEPKTSTSLKDHSKQLILQKTHDYLSLEHHHPNYYTLNTLFTQCTHKHPNRGCMLTSFPRILDVYSLLRGLHRQFLTFSTYFADVRTSVFVLAETLGIVKYSKTYSYASASMHIYKHTHTYIYIYIYIYIHTSTQ